MAFLFDGHSGRGVKGGLLYRSDSAPPSLLSRL